MIPSDLKSAISRIVADMGKGKKLVRLTSGQFYFIVGKKFRLLEYYAIDQLITENWLKKTFKFRGIQYYSLI